MSKRRAYDSSKNYIVDKDVALPALTDELLNFAINMFEYKNLPETIPVKNLEKYLMTLGFCSVMKFGNDLYAVDGTLGGPENVYHEPTEFVYANQALNSSGSVSLDDCVLCRNDALMQGLMPIINKYANLMLESNISLRTTLILSRMNVCVSASDDRTKASADKYLHGIESGQLYTIAESAFFDGVKFHTTASSTNFITQIIEMAQYVKGSFLQAIGVNSPHNMKRQYVNVEDTGLAEDGLRPLVDNMLFCRQQFVDEINKKFGTDISVDFNSIWKVKEEDQLDESSRLDKDDDNELKNEGQEVGTEEKTPSETSKELPPENNEEEKA